MSTIFRLVLRTQLTKGRGAALGSVSLLGMVLALAVGRAAEADRFQASFELVEAFGLSLLVPITALVFASAALGDPAEDGTLVYLWLRPISRFKIALSSLAGAVAVALPFGVLPTVAIAAISGGGGALITGSLLASTIALVAYSTLFLGLGLIVRRALVWGLAYVLIWEGFVARSGTGAARLSVLVYARSVLADIAGREAPRLASSTTIGVIVPLVIGALALALTTSFLRRLDVR